MTLNELLKEGIESNSFYFNIQTPNGNEIMLDLDILEYDETTDYTEYIINLLSFINEIIITHCEEFDAEDKFKSLQQYYSHQTPGLVLEELIEDEKFFNNFAKNLKTYGPEKIRKENSDHEANI